MEGDETGHFILFRPAHETRIQSRQTLQTERQVLSSLQQQASRESGSGPASTLPLQRRVPVLPAEEIVLLQVGRPKWYPARKSRMWRFQPARWSSRTCRKVYRFGQFHRPAGKKRGGAG